ncbi:hypothetical protein C0992_008234 [Termitomyces sp. T32_za158]|nr:hypothetical protein C0992_008234 [Termitomyces sp. T32_za158]
MFVRFPALCMTVALAVCASAASVGVRDGGSGGNSCDANTGTQQCCNSIAQSSDSSVEKLAALLGVVLGPVDALVGRQ